MLWRLWLSQVLMFCPVEVVEVVSILADEVVAEVGPVDGFDS